jgi:hypothetical protein
LPLISQFEAGLVRAAVLHLIACFGICGILLFVVAYRTEVNELLQGAFAALTEFLVRLNIPRQMAQQSTGDTPAPTQRSSSALFQRPPPLLA